MMSEKKNYYMILTEGGDLRVYVSSHFVDKNIIFSSKSEGKGKGPYRLVVQEDGNVVIYDGTNAPTWASNTHGKGKAPHTLLLQDDGNLCLYGAGCRCNWTTNTCRE